MSSALNHGVQKGWLKGNVLRHSMQKTGKYQQRPRTRLPTAEDLEAFTTATYTTSHRPDLKKSKTYQAPVCPAWMAGYIVLKRITGLRQGQLLKINLTTMWDGKMLTPEVSKGGKATSYYGQPLEDAIEMILGDRLAVGPLFLNSKRKPLTASGLKSAWTRAMNRWDGEKFREHDVRKYTASEADTLGHAQRLLGHQSPKVTREVYRLTERVEVLEK